MKVRFKSKISALSLSLILSCVTNEVFTLTSRENSIIQMDNKISTLIVPILLILHLNDFAHCTSLPQRLEGGEALNKGGITSEINNKMTKPGTKISRRSRLLKELTMLNRQSCLSKIVCGVEVAKKPSSATSTINDYAYIVKNFFDQLSTQSGIKNALELDETSEEENGDLLKSDYSSSSNSRRKNSKRPYIDSSFGDAELDKLYKMSLEEMIDEDVTGFDFKRRKGKNLLKNATSDNSSKAGQVTRGYMGFYNPRFDKTSFLNHKQLQLEQAKNDKDKLTIATEIATKLRSPRQCRLLGWFRPTYTTTTTITTTSDNPEMAVTSGAVNSMCPFTVQELQTMILGSQTKLGGTSASESLINQLASTNPALFQNIPTTAVPVYQYNYDSFTKKPSTLPTKIIPPPPRPLVVQTLAYRNAIKRLTTTRKPEIYDETVPYLQGASSYYRPEDDEKLDIYGNEHGDIVPSRYQYRALPPKDKIPAHMFIRPINKYNENRDIPGRLPIDYKIRSDLDTNSDENSPEEGSSEEKSAEDEENNNNRQEEASMPQEEMNESDENENEENKKNNNLSSNTKKIKMHKDVREHSDKAQNLDNEATLIHDKVYRPHVDDSEEEKIKEKAFMRKYEESEEEAADVEKPKDEDSEEENDNKKEEKKPEESEEDPENTVLQNKANDPTVSEENNDQINTSEADKPEKEINESSKEDKSNESEEQLDDQHNSKESNEEDGPQENQEQSKEDNKDEIEDPTDQNEESEEMPSNKQEEGLTKSVNNNRNKRGQDNPEKYILPRNKSPRISSVVSSNENQNNKDSKKRGGILSSILSDHGLHTFTKFQTFFGYGSTDADSLPPPPNQSSQSHHSHPRPRPPKRRRKKNRRRPRPHHHPHDDESPSDDEESDEEQDEEKTPKKKKKKVIQKPTQPRRPLSPLLNPFYQIPNITPLVIEDNQSWEGEEKPHENEEFYEKKTKPTEKPEKYDYDEEEDDASSNKESIYNPNLKKPEYGGVANDRYVSGLPTSWESIYEEMLKQKQTIKLQSNKGKGSDEEEDDDRSSNDSDESEEDEETQQRPSYYRPREPAGLPQRGESTEHHILEPID